MMAYRNFSDAPFTDIQPAARPQVEAITLSPLERTTVLLSMHDGRCSLVQSKRFDRVVGALFGISRPSRLADVRLEALRRYAVLLRLEGDAIDPAEAATLREVGFSESQLVAIRVLLAQAG